MAHDASGGVFTFHRYLIILARRPFFVLLNKLTVLTESGYYRNLLAVQTVFVREKTTLLDYDLTEELRQTDQLISIDRQIH